MIKNAVASSDSVHFEVSKAPTRYLRFYRREKKIGAHLDFHVSCVGNLITHFTEWALSVTVKQMK